VFSGFESLKLTVNDDVQATRRGNIAWTTATLHATVMSKGGTTPMEMDARQTAIWEKRGGQWLIIHEHISAPLPEESMKAEKVEK
jgi:ketosteroid isomerase-like protein